ncbi:acyltransferase family protein [Bacillus sp. 03113]|uniref:acyltransferase family protein n=1 Tax=Bacillus sp. 03113 TaxID=2578211 RepID=UPI00215C2041|nr:acyltransferase family protein [Bacillus sp. 03113]
MKTTSNRNLYFDNAKLFLIFLVVFGHVISPFKEGDNILFTLYSVIFLFHMPAFILICGHFSKGFQQKSYFLKTIKKILLPYFIFQGIYSFFYYWSGHEKTLTFDLFMPHWTLWFLLSLFCWNILLYVFARWRWYGLILSIALGIGVGYIDEVGSYLSLSRTFVFFPYFLLGYLLNSSHITWLKRVKFSIALSLVMILGTVLIFSVSFPKEAIPWLLGDTSYADMGVKEIADGLIRCGQYVLTTIVLFCFFSLVPKKEYKLTVLGQRTLYIYLLHGFIIKLNEIFVPERTLQQLAENYTVLIIYSLFLCLLLGNYMTKKLTLPLIELKI